MSDHHQSPPGSRQHLRRVCVRSGREGATALSHLHENGDVLFGRLCLGGGEGWTFRMVECEVRRTLKSGSTLGVGALASALHCCGSVHSKRGMGSCHLFSGFGLFVHGRDSVGGSFFSRHVFRWVCRARRLVAAHDQARLSASCFTGFFL